MVEGYYHTMNNDNDTTRTDTMMTGTEIVLRGERGGRDVEQRWIVDEPLPNGGALMTRVSDGRPGKLAGGKVTWIRGTRLVVLMTNVTTEIVS